jgi:hypothetical protein
VSNLAAVRQILETIRTIGPALSNDEINGIVKVLAGALERLEREGGQRE